MNDFAEKTFDDIARRIASSLKIEEGASEDQKAQTFQKWMKSWASLAPQNGNSNRTYNGCNQMLLGMMMSLNQWKDPFFMTFNGVKQKGGIVKKGEKSLPIFWFEMIPVKDKETGEVKGCFPKLKVFNVFHVSQTTVDPSECQVAKCEGRKNSEIDALVANLGVVIEDGDPSYNMVTDVVKMPKITAFKTETDFYSTIFHELTHYTMHKDRCNRVGEKKLPYAQEELVAELGSAFLCAEFGIEGELQHTEYIGSWITNLKNHPRSFFDSARMAQKAANFILQKKYEKKEEENDEKAA